MKPSLLLAAVLAVGIQLPSIARAVAATGLSSFEGIEEPLVRYAPASGTFTRDEFINITAVDERTFRMALRYRSDEWDGDRDTPNRDRQRAEVKGLGPHQKDGETFDYTTTWRTNPSFKGASRFCHVFQLKATDGDSGAPLVTVSVHEGPDRASVQYWVGPARSSTTVRDFAWTSGTWQTVRVRIKPSTTTDGEVLASVEGDELQGVRGVAVYRTGSTDYRPKWGLYRGASTRTALGDDYVEHRDVSAEKVGAVVLTDVVKLESAARKLAQSSPAEALAWVQTQPSSPARAVTLATIAALWSETEPSAAMAYAEKLDPSDGRSDAVQRVFNRWADRDAAAVVRWVAGRAPAAELDPLLWYFTTDTTLRYVDRSKALDCAPLIADPELRARAIEHVVLIWARRDRVNAALYIEQIAALSPAQKDAILKKFPGAPALKS